MNSRHVTSFAAMTCAGPRCLGEMPDVEPPLATKTATLISAAANAPGGPVSAYLRTAKTALGARVPSDFTQGEPAHRLAWPMGVSAVLTRSPDAHHDALAEARYP